MRMKTAELSDRVAIVTGAGKGIGQATAVALATLGAKVVLSGRSREPLEQTLLLVERAGGRGLMVIGDVADERVAAETVAQAVQRFGRLDIAVNNAGVSPWTGNTVDCTLETWQSVISVNLTGIWLGMKHQIPAMLESGRGGAIVNMASVAALRAFPGYPCYSASKWGVVGITKVAAREFASQRVRVNVIAPGSIDTPLFAEVVDSTPTSRSDYEKQTPMARIAKAEEVAAAAAWLCSDAASYVTGAVLPVDGGMTL
jgi:NAD(P)-dependent dehydrogenase (short-subunit alcohol dehydrogenase family)